VHGDPHPTPSTTNCSPAGDVVIVSDWVGITKVVSDVLVVVPVLPVPVAAMAPVVAAFGTVAVMVLPLHETGDAATPLNFT
jgi:hypothetical protein